MINSGQTLPLTTQYPLGTSFERLVHRSYGEQRAGHKRGIGFVWRLPEMPLRGLTPVLGVATWFSGPDTALYRDELSPDLQAAQLRANERRGLPIAELDGMFVTLRI